jgi:hypothetical protein
MDLCAHIYHNQAAGKGGREPMNTFLPRNVHAGGLFPDHTRRCHSRSILRSSVSLADSTWIHLWLLCHKCTRLGSACNRISCMAASESEILAVDQVLLPRRTFAAPFLVVERKSQVAVYTCRIFSSLSNIQVPYCSSCALTGGFHLVDPSTDASGYCRRRWYDGK